MTTKVSNNIIIGNIFDIIWVAAGKNYQGFSNSGNSDLVWIKQQSQYENADKENTIIAERSLKIMVATQATSHKTIAQGIKKTLARKGHSVKYPELQDIISWIKNNRSR